LLNLTVADIVDNPNRLTTGPHCEHCLGRKQCPERLAEAHTALALVPSDPTILALTDDQALHYALARGALRERLDRLDDALMAYLDAGGQVISNGKRMKVSRYKVDKVVGHEGIISDLAVLVGGPAHQAIRTTKEAIGEALASVGKKHQMSELMAGWRERGLVRKEERRQLRWRGR
jgi:hypothetical protein